jgi:hypothetical protein
MKYLLIKNIGNAEYEKVEVVNGKKEVTTPTSKERGPLGVLCPCIVIPMQAYL